MKLNLVDYFVRWWKTEDSQEKIERTSVDLIAPVSYTTLPDRLTAATEASLRRAIEVQKVHPLAPIVFTGCSYPFPNAARSEKYHKVRILRDASVTSFAYAGAMNNSVEEAFRVAEYVKSCSVTEPQTILLVTGEMHSRSARLIWEKVFPQAVILIECIPHTHEYEPGHRVKIQRGAWRWLYANIARHILLKLLPLRTVGKFRHNAA